MNEKLEKILREMPETEDSARQILEAAILVTTDPTRKGSFRGPEAFFRAVGEILSAHKGVRVEALAMNPGGQERAKDGFERGRSRGEHTLEDCMKCDQLDSCPEAAEKLREAGAEGRKRIVH